MKGFSNCIQFLPATFRFYTICFQTASGFWAAAKLYRIENLQHEKIFYIWRTCIWRQTWPYSLLFFLKEQLHRISDTFTLLSSATRWGKTRSFPVPIRNFPTLLLGIEFRFFLKNCPHLAFQLLAKIIFSSVTGPSIRKSPCSQITCRILNHIHVAYYDHAHVIIHTNSASALPRLKNCVRN